MKQLLILLSFILFLSGAVCASGDDKRVEFSVKETTKGKTSSDWSTASLSLELKNLTDDTLIFLSETCLRNAHLFSTDDDSIFPNLKTCIGSNPIFLKLLPHNSYNETIEIASLHKNLGIPPFKMKINLIEPKEKTDPWKAYLEKDKPEFSLYTNYIKIK